MIETQIQMRFADIDVLGHVNNVNQQHYFDLGKCDFYKQVLGLTPYWKTAGLIIVASQTNYLVQTRRSPYVPESSGWATKASRCTTSSSTPRLNRSRPNARPSWWLTISTSSTLSKCRTNGKPS